MAGFNMVTKPTRSIHTINIYNFLGKLPDHKSTPLFATCHLYETVSVSYNGGSRFRVIYNKTLENCQLRVH